jgi:hypothetical protein
MVDCSLLSYQSKRPWELKNTFYIKFNEKKIFKKVKNGEYRSGRWYKIKDGYKGNCVYVYFIIDYRAKYCYVFDVSFEVMECDRDCVTKDLEKLGSEHVMKEIISLSYEGDFMGEYCKTRQYLIEKMGVIESGMRRYKRLNFNSYVNRLNQSIDENIIDHIVD